MELSGVLKSELAARKQPARAGLLRSPCILTYGTLAKLCLMAGFFITLSSMLGCQSLSDATQSWRAASLKTPLPAEEAQNQVASPPKDSSPEATPFVETPPSVSSVGAEEKAKPSPSVDTTAEKKSSENSSTANAESTFRIADVKTILAKSGGWIGTPQTLRDAKTAQNEVVWNWYHPGIEEVLAWPEENGPTIHEVLEKKEPVSATNAAICLARLGDSSGVSVLLGAIRSPRLDMSLRAAAAEALASLDSSAQTVQNLIDEFGDEGKTPHPDIYRELISGLARHLDPAGDHRFLAALKSRSAEVRLAAIEAWSKSESKILPDELVYLVADQNDKNRSAVMHALGTHDHPQRMHYLNAGLHDVNYLVRVAAVEALGQIGSKEAIDRLEEATASNSPIVRAEAVRSLAVADQCELALKQAKDEAWQVRFAVAEVLAETKTPNAKELEAARVLLHDRSPQVQSRTLDSIDMWPLAKSGPLLIEAIEKLGFQTRQEATTQLAKHWEPAKRFPRHAPEEVRQRAIAQLRSEFQQEFGAATTTAMSAEDNSSATRVTQETIDPTWITHAKRLIAKHEDPRCASADRYQIRQTLGNLGPAPMVILEHLVFKEHQKLPEEFYTTLLPELDPTFDILYRMQENTEPSTKISSEKSMERRHAASDLIRLTAEHKPSRLAMDRLAEQMLQESDTLVWRSVLIAFANNDSEPMLQMIRVAIGHDSAEIRRRACEWMAAHPDPSYFKLLKPALEDTNQKVKIAAIRAIVAGGKLEDAAPLKNILDEDQQITEVRDQLIARIHASGNPSQSEFEKAEPSLANLQEIEPLKKLLGDSSEELRLEVAYALAAFGDEDGPQALKRLAQSRDANVRQKAAEAMGQLEDPRYTSLLINLLDDQLNVRRAALGALPKSVGHEVPAAGDRSPRTPTEKIARWKEWYAHRTGSSLR